jgi:hypothetical protein
VADDSSHDWKTAHGLFAYELASGILTGLVINGILSKDAALALIADTKDYLSRERAAPLQEIEQIAAKATAQVAMLTVQAQRQIDRDDG